MHFKVGSRSSSLALKQTNTVINELKKINSDFTFEIVNITSSGDINQHSTISGIGVEGVFVKELEEALVDHQVDFVVHSLKDMPTLIHSQCEIMSVLKRTEVRDVLVSKNNINFTNLPAGSSVGTSSIRRVCQLKSMRNNLNYQNIRGNLPTRLKKLEDGQYDAIILAAAGLERLGLSHKICQYFDVFELTPPAGQGTLAVECLISNDKIAEILKYIDDSTVRAQITAERSFLAKLGGGCSYPIGATAWVDDDHKLNLLGCVASLDGSSVIRHTLSHEFNNSREAQEKLGETLALHLINNGALKLLSQDVKSISN